MGLQENKAVYLRFIEEVFNRGDFSHLDELLADNYKIQGVQPASSPADAVRASATMFRTAFPDLHIEVEEVIAEGNTVAARARLTGTQLGEFLGTPPTGRSVSVSNLTILHLRDGKMAESWVADDFQAMKRQLGP